VTAHALLIFDSKFGQIHLKLMTGAAFYVYGLVEVHFGRCIGIRHLIMRVMARNTKAILFALCDRFPTMGPLDNVIPGAFMAINALFRSEMIFQAHVDICGIGMGLICGDVCMTVLTGYLTVSRNVESFDINQPGRFNIGTNKNGTTDHGYGGNKSLHVTIVKASSV
jgi:hypothetical protein